MASRRIVQQVARAVSDTVTVRVKQGLLRGARVTSQYGGDYVTFRGVPYAKPPVGELRFRAPQPPEPWSGVRDAFEEGAICPQRDIYTQKMRGDEDCLFLNIHTPKLTAESLNNLKAVIVCISGGAFTSGHGNVEIFGPDFIVREDTILVTINFRVGALGFLSLEEAGISGNAGLKDQVFALRWVKENIVNFGGDPDNITLFGDSAGGCAVHLQIVSPMTKGLVARAVASSGTSLVPFSFMDKEFSRKRAFALGELFGLKTTKPDELADYLRKIPAVEIAKNQSKIMRKVENQRGDAISFLPTIEHNPHPEEEVFLPDSPHNIMNRGEFNKMPLMLSVSSHEGILLLRNFFADPTLWKNLDENFEKFIVMPLDLNVERHTDIAREVAAKIRNFYYGENKTITEKDALIHCELSTDIFFNVGIHNTLKQTVKYSPYPTYMMEYAFDGQLALFKKFVGASGLPGACHGDRNCNLFKYGLVDYDLHPDSLDCKIQNFMIKTLINYAKTGNPTPKSDTSLDVTWEPATPENKMAYMCVDDEIELKTDRIKERLNFWDGIYQQYGNKYITRKSSHL